MYSQPSEGVQQVVRVFGAKAREHDPPLVGLPIAIQVAEMEELGAIGHVGPVRVVGNNAGGNQQPLREDGRLVGPPIEIGIFQDEDFVAGLLARKDVRIDFAGGNPQPALGIEVHLDRFGQERLGRPEVDFQTLSQAERLALQLRIGVGNGFQVALRQGGRHDGRDQPRRQDGTETRKPHREIPRLPGEF
jgi:hypothetical protein